MRRTKKDLYFVLDHINKMLNDHGFDIEYGLDIAYGGYRLVKYVGTGEVDRGPRVTCGQLYDTLYTLECILYDLFY